MRILDVMRHKNGVFTQCYNRLKHTDGPLFRGRYKAILVEEDNYLLQLSRYIHRNPIETKQPLVKKLEQYPWSSYPAYINKSKTPQWLHRDTLYDILGQRQKYYAYQSFVALGNNKEINDFYNRTNIASVTGRKEFIAWLKDEIIPELEDSIVVNKLLSLSLTITQITQLVAKYHKLDVKKLAQVNKGPNKGLLTRKIAMYLCQQPANHPLQDIMIHFGLSNIGAVSFITSQIRQKCKNNSSFEKQIQKVQNYIIKQAT